MKNIENLVFKGGGIKGIAYAGALRVINELNILKTIKRTAGTSAGAIVATLIAIGYEPEELYQLLKETNFKKFEDKPRLFGIITKYGIYKGDSFIKWLSDAFKAKNISALATFKDFREQGLIDPYVFAVNLNTQNVEGFSIDRTPNVRVIEAVRASMSIPMFFKAWKFSPGTHCQDIYVDGGTIYNYPISVFDNDMFLEDNEVINPRTLGFYLTNLDGKNADTEFDFNMPISYVKHLFWSILDGQVVNFKRNPEDLKRTVLINDYGISPIEFNISNSKKKRLVESGEESIRKYFGIV